jgi:sulfur-oxidizing protein SoxY
MMRNAHGAVQTFLEEAMVQRMNRREAMGAGAGAVAAALGVAPALALNDYADRIKVFTGGKDPVEGHLKIELPELAENGNTVPLSVAISSPLPADVHVQEILVLAPANPNARVIRFRFSAASVPQVSTRIRLAETQNVMAVAKLSDGRFVLASRQIKVTIGGCGG